MTLLFLCNNEDNMENMTFSQISKFLLKCKKELDKWFEIDLPMPELMVLQSAEDAAAIWDIEPGESPPIGWADIERHKLYILSPAEALKFNIKTYNLRSLIKHEYTHLYWRAIVGSSRPIWMDEGLACYLAKKPFKLRSKNLILKIQDYFDRKTFDTYAVGYFSVKYLLERFGRKKFLAFLKKLSKLPSKITRKIDKKEFEQLFQKHFHLSLSRRAIKQILKDIP